MVPLKLFYHGGREDNFTTAIPEAAEGAEKVGYSFARVEAHIFPTQQPGTVPLKSYWHSERGDNFTLATADSEAAAREAGYVFSRIEGYIYPDARPGTVPLQSYWHPGRGDHFATATEVGAKSAADAGYVFVRVEGYVMPAAARVSMGRARPSPPPPAPPVPPPSWRVPPSLGLQQGNGWGVSLRLTQEGIHIAGPATGSKLGKESIFTGADVHSMSGSADGTIVGDTFEVNVFWAPDSIGIYHGTINPQGRIEGTNYNRSKPNEKTTFFSTTFLTRG